MLVRCSVSLGRQGDARRAAASALALVAPMGGLRMAEAMADRAKAVVALAAGDSHEAARSAIASAEAADGVGIRIEAALSRTLAGCALARVHQARPAVSELERAASALHASGAVRYRDAAELELRRLGRLVHRRRERGGGTAVGVGSLSAREREVADLVVDRRTNPEIAESLFLSPKTVETHMRHIFRKLDVESRADVARAVEAATRGSPHAR